MPAGRRRVEHPGRKKTFNFSMLFILATFIGGFAVIGAMEMAGIEQENPLPQVIVKGVALLCAASIVHGLWAYIRLRIYRCPTCGAKTATVDEAYPAIHKFCAACGVEWITGLAHGESLD